MHEGIWKLLFMEIINDDNSASPLSDDAIYH